MTHLFSLIRVICLLGALTVSVPAGAMAQTLPGPLKTFIVQMSEPPEDVAQTLQALLGTEVQMVEAEGIQLISFSGLNIPPALQDFVLTTVPEIDKDLLAPGSPANISMALVPDQTGFGTEIRLMISSPKLAEPDALRLAMGADLPPGAEVLMNDGVTGGCAGQVILSHPGPPALAAPLYLERIKAQGFEITDASDPNLSFFIGQRQDCALFVYVQPDPAATSRSTVIVRYLED